ncbi:MAG TPA: DNA polymerase IV [Thermoanaerobaculia bacterium]|nr:DNA polymerase IV [Thermoanaerobaculia bacterium]
MSPPRRILHCDMDSFYAAVHQRDDPSLVGKPVVIGGDPSGRGVVAAASYEVRRFGVRSAMPSAEARRRCPHAVFIRPDFQRYRRESEAIFALYREVTPLVQAVSIDEAYLDVSDHLGDHGSATAVAKAIRARVRDERGLTVSVGVGPNKLVAKIASDHGKPDGLVVVKPSRVAAFLEPLPVRRLHGVGPATERALGELGVATVAELRGLPVELLTSRFGRHGAGLFRFARGVDERPVETDRVRKSLGTENTYSRDLERREAMEEELVKMAHDVAASLEKREIAGRTVTVKVRYPDFVTVTRSQTLPAPTADAATVARLAVELLAKTDAGERPVRLLGVTVSNLDTDGVWQLPLFEGD